MYITMSKNITVSDLFIDKTINYKTKLTWDSLRIHLHCDLYLDPQLITPSTHYYPPRCYHVVVSPYIKNNDYDLIFDFLTPLTHIFVPDNLSLPNGPCNYTQI